MECLGATPLERLCGYIINLFPVPLLYRAELWAWLREYCCGAIIPLSVSFSLSPPLSFSLYPLPCLCHSTSFSEDCLRKGAGARRWEEEMIRSIFLSGNRLPLPLPLCLSPSASACLLYSRLVWPHHWRIAANFTSKSDKQPYSTCHGVCDKLDTQFPYNGGGDRDKESRSGGWGRQWNVSQCHD